MVGHVEICNNCRGRVRKRLSVELRVKAEENGGTLTKGGRLERNGFPDPLADRVPDRVDPADQIEVVDILERALILSPVGRLDRDEAVVRAFLGEDDRVRPPAAKESTFTQR
jgi:hypothetical protein